MKNFICLFFILCSFSLFAQIQQAPLFPIKAEQNIPAIDKTSTDGVVKNAKDQKREIPIQKVIKVTSVKKGLAIETTGVADVAKAEIAEGKIFANLKWIVSLVKDDATFNNYVETYRSSSTDTIKRQAAKDMLKTIYNLVFAKNSYNNTLMTLASALESHGGKFLYDCKASSFENIEILESKFDIASLPIKLLDCQGYYDSKSKTYNPDHTLLKWKFSSTDLYWDTTTGGKDPSPEKITRYSENCTEITPGSDQFYARFYFQRGNAERTSNNHNAAITSYNNAIENDLSYAFAYTNRGSLKALSGYSYEDAMADLNTAIDLNKTLEVSYNNRGYVNSLFGKYDLAIDDYKKAMALNPANTERYLKMIEIAK